MIFLHPAILFGLFAVGLPVAIHLLRHTKLREIKWATNKFLLKSIQKNRRRLQTEDLLLLILRCLFVALVVILFGRPAFLTDDNFQVGDEATTAVILLDNSASMGQYDGEQTRFDQAKTMIDGILTKFAPGSSSALYLVSDHATPLISKPTQDFSVLRRSLAQASLTDCGTDLFPGLRDAVTLLKAAHSPHREIFLLTDSQVSAWRELAKIRQLQDANKKEISIHFVVVGNKGEDNLAVSRLQIVGTVTPIGQPLRCTVEVSNWSKNQAQNVQVKLAADDGPPQDETMIDSIPPNGSNSVNLDVRFREPGYHSITASIMADALPADNQRSATVLVVSQVNALVVEGTTNPSPVLRDGFFLRHALVPVAPDKAEQYYMKVKVGQINDLENPNLNQNQLVFLSNVSEVTPGGVSKLKDFLNQGGAVIIFPGPATDIAFYNTQLNFLMPAKLGPLQQAPAGQKFLNWQDRGFDHPVTALWNDPEAGNLGSVHVSKYFPLTVKTDSSGPLAPKIVVKYANGETAVVEQTVGKGKVFLFSSTATTAWTSLPIHPAFVPLLIRIVSYATGGVGEKFNIAPGEPFAFEVDSTYAGGELSVIRPGEKKRRIVGRVEAGDHSSFLRYADTDRAGVYQLFVDEDPKPKVVFAVQGDPEESNLNQEPTADIASLLAPTAPTPDDVANSKSKTDGGRIPGREIWYPLALAALVIALADTLLAHRFSQPK